MLFCLRRQPETRLRREPCLSYGQQSASVRQSNRTVQQLAIDHVEIHIQRIVIHHLLEFATRYFVGRQVFDILVIPFELDSAADD